MHYLDDFSYIACYDKVMALKPESFLDIGCRCGFTLWRVQQKIDVTKTKGLESEADRYMRRVARNIAQCDLLGFPWPISRNYDLGFTFFVLDGVPDEFAPGFVSEIKKHTKRGLHYVSDAILDKWQQLLGPDHHFIRFSEYEKTVATNEFNKGVKKLNYGCGKRMFLNGWINLDIQAPAGYNNYIFFQHDTRKRIEDCQDNIITAIVSHHMLPYLTVEETKVLLEDCWRISVVGAFIRISIPNPAVIDSMPPDIYSAAPGEGGDWRQGVKKIYTAEEVMELLKNAGFTNIQESEFGKSISETIQSETYDCYPQFSTFIEGRKLVL